MNVNQLLHDHQIAALMAQHAPSRNNREAHCKLAGHHARRITDWRETAGLSMAGWPIELPDCRAEYA